MTFKTTLSYDLALFLEVFMSDKSWGTKRVCLFCGTSFYDFGKTPIVCPKCGEAFEQGLIFKKKNKGKDFDEINALEEEINEAEGDSSIDEPEADEEEV